MKILPLLTGLLLTGLPAMAVPDSFIWIDVSIKVIVDPATGVVPSTMSDDLLHDSFDDMNRWLANTWRGYRVRAVDTSPSGSFKRIGGLNDTTGPGKWYLTDLKSEGQVRNDFEDAANANKALYGWNDNAINIYFNNKDYSSASLPQGGRALVASAYALLQDDKPAGAAFTQSYKVAGNLLHEIGHWFGLYHTFETEGTDGGDEMADTAPDPNNYCCGARVEGDVLIRIAHEAYDTEYYLLTAEQKVLVNNTANNAMAYIQLFYDDPPQGKFLTDAERFGPTRFLFTEMQMDRWAGYANADRSFATSGRSIFLNAATGFSGSGHPTFPFKQLTTAINAADSSGGDIIVALPGSYTTAASGTITKPCTIRATRRGSVVISKP